jgi:hypothetical protein
MRHVRPPRLPQSKRLVLTNILRDRYGLSAKVAESKKDLQETLGSDYRGLVVSMIHKFDDIPANINTRDSAVVLVDEAHRTTGGDLGNYLMGALPNATYIGFTGTPVDRISRGQGTFKVFGGDDESGYLDKYSIAESIKDGTTVTLNYALAPSTLRVDRGSRLSASWSRLTKTTNWVTDDGNSTKHCSCLPPHPASELVNCLHYGPMTLTLNAVRFVSMNRLTECVRSALAKMSQRTEQ